MDKLRKIIIFIAVPLIIFAAAYLITRAAPTCGVGQPCSIISIYNGNSVGINTSTPSSATLTVVGSSTPSNIFLAQNATGSVSLNYSNTGVLTLTGGSIFAPSVSVSGLVSANSVSATTLIGSLNASYVAAGTFGSNIGGGNFSFPNGLSVNTTTFFEGGAPNFQVDGPGFFYSPSNPQISTAIGNGAISFINSNISATIGASASGTILFLDSNDNPTFMFDQGGNGAFLNSLQIGTTTTSTATFKVSNASSSAALVVVPSGNVGIGTTTPSNPLTVSGNANFSGQVGIGTTVSTSINLVSSNTNGIEAIEGDSSGSLGNSFGILGGYNLGRVGVVGGGIGVINNNSSGSSGGGWDFWAKNNGCIAGPMNTSLGEYSLCIQANGVVTFNNTTTQTFAAINSNGNSYFNGGNVGIGTTTPSNPLTVSGNANFSGQVGIGTTTSNYSLNIEGGTGYNGIYVHSNVADGYGINVSSGGRYGVYAYTTGPATYAIYGSGAAGYDFGGVNGEYTNGGVWTNGSSRALKTDFTNLNKDDILNKIMKLPITKWVYKSSPDQWHIGPMAEDFYPLFGTSNDKSIDTESPAGVALIGIQALNDKITAQQTEINSLKSLVCSDHPKNSYCQAKN
ncbi:MAG: tail fiber domain-containing protein [Patescibacteria group bacterium]|nr:tail fiber domain-containing protein [Patescibacteria group bacterium]